MKFYLLTHPREFSRPTNTGRLVTAQLRAMDNSAAPGHEPTCRVIPWSRTDPDPALLRDIEARPTVLISTKGEGVQVDESRLAADFDQVILLDGTWQEANKMYNRSPYLKQLPYYRLVTHRPSIFTLRANQVPGGLSTVETVAHLLRLAGNGVLATHLDRALERLLAPACSQPGEPRRKSDESQLS